MGLFSKIKKIGKKIFKGVKKVFKKVTKFIGKIAGSKWGKALLLAASVFTLGTAAMAGFQGFAASAAQGANGFFSNFVAGGKEFLGALANPVAKGKELLGIGAEAAPAGGFTGSAIHAAGAAEQAGAAGNMVAGATGAAKDFIKQGVAMGGNTGGLTSTVANVTAPVVNQGAGAGGFLSKAAGAAFDFAKSSGGGTVLSGALKGYAEGRAEEARMEDEERVRRYYDEQWRDPGKLAQLQGAVGGDVGVPGGYLDRARRVNEFLNNRDYAYPTQPGNADQLAGYARSPGT